MSKRDPYKYTYNGQKFTVVDRNSIDKFKNRKKIKSKIKKTLQIAGVILTTAVIAIAGIEIKKEIDERIRREEEEKRMAEINQRFEAGKKVDADAKISDTFDIVARYYLTPESGSLDSYDNRYIHSKKLSSNNVLNTYSTILQNMVPNANKDINNLDFLVLFVDLIQDDLNSNDNNKRNEGITYAHYLQEATTQMIKQFVFDRSQNNLQGHPESVDDITIRCNPDREYVNIGYYYTSKYGDRIEACVANTQFYNDQRFPSIPNELRDMIIYLERGKKITNVDELDEFIGEDLGKLMIAMGSYSIDNSINRINEYPNAWATVWGDQQRAYREEKIDSKLLDKLKNKQSGMEI